MPLYRGTRLLKLRRPVAAVVLPATSYVSGDRSGSITVTFTGTLLAAPGGVALVNGSYVVGSPGSTFFNGTTNSSADQIIFDFGVPKYVTEAKWYQSTNATHGTWQWIGSSDGSTGTNIGASFTPGGIADGSTGASPQVITTLNSNAALYRYYILQGVSGSRSGAPWLEEVEFKQN